MKEKSTALEVPWVFDRDEQSVCIRWAPIDGARRYALQMRVCMKSTQDKAEEFQTLSRSIKSTSARKNHLHDELYEFRVAAITEEDDDGDQGEIPETAWSASLVTGPINPVQLTQMPPPRVFDFDAISATILWETLTPQGHVPRPPFALEMCTDQSRWQNVSSNLNGDRVRKKNLESGKSYYFRIKPVIKTLPECDWSRASIPITIPEKSLAMASIFGDTLLNARSEALNTVDILAGKLIAVYASASW
uniref:Fibronectin type-III domain-containing protein n=1 Tax=Aureoumbra lagunensis TaxID=44058 RepID=A0A7S3JMQ7_9STRA|mmetsp:Transcript_17185/g.22346  ORF Transcript_17185/g.22346 Transcript_17185/m.22346 type:complete len:248 (+) Transcript_17185:22-765(+)